MIRPGFEGSYTVVAIGLNSEGEWAICNAAGHDYRAEPKFHSRQDAERERDRLLDKWKSPYSRPDFWSTSLHLEIMTELQWADAVESGNYVSFYDGPFRF